MTHVCQYSLQQRLISLQFFQITSLYSRNQNIVKMLVFFRLVKVVLEWAAMLP